MGHSKRELVSNTGKEIFDAVVKAMQPAEEMGGPCGDEYDQLMRMIAEEATARADTYAIEKGNRKLFAALSDALFKLRARFNVGATPDNRNAAAAMLESFGSFAGSLADGDAPEDALRGLRVNLDDDVGIIGMGDPKVIAAAVKYVNEEPGAFPDVPGHLLLTDKQVKDLVESLYEYDRSRAKTDPAYYEQAVRNDGATSISPMRVIVSYYFAHKQDGK